MESRGIFPGALGPMNFRPDPATFPRDLASSFFAEFTLDDYAYHSPQSGLHRSQPFQGDASRSGPPLRSALGWRASFLPHQRSSCEHGQ